MSNQLLNKLKGIETSRASLENLLKEKEIDIGNSKSLPSLVAQVSKLKNPNWTESSEKWGGLTEEETPVDYYKGDDDWKDLIDIDSIIEEYDSTSYQGAVFMLFRVSANPNDSWSSSYLDGFTAYRFSDTKTVSTSLAHTWDADQDIIAENGERFRWIICFTSSTSCVGIWSAQYLVPEAVVYYKGQFRGCTLLNQSTSNYYLDKYSDETSTSTTSYYPNGDSVNYNSPKYFEIKEGVTCDVVAGSPNSVYSVKTVIINGIVRSTIYLGVCPDLRYFIYTNQVTPKMRVCLPRSIQATENDKCYIKFNYPIVLRDASNANGDGSSGFGIGNFMYNNYTNIYLNDISNLYRNNFSNNSNCNIKIENILNGGTSTNTTTFGYNKNCNIDIAEIYAVGANCFDFCKDTNIKIGTIWGGIGNFAFRYCNKMNNDIICKSKSSTTYSLGYQPFYGTNIKVVDMSESRIINLSTYGSISPMLTDSQYNYYGQFSFANNPTIEVVKLSNYITDIPNYSFSYMTNLKEFDMGSSVTNIGNYVFYHCENLETIICSPTLQTIDEYCFAYCSALNTIDLGKQITKIPKYCFQHCASLKNIFLPDSLTTFGDYCFQYCTSLKTITLPNELTILPNYCFQYCSSLETINTTGTITNIGNYCFSYCSNLKNIFDFAGVVTIGPYAFEYCKSLTLKLNNLSGIVSNNALKNTWSYIICDTNYDIVSNLYLWGAKWDNQGVLNFLYSLPTREEKSDYTIYFGYSYPAYCTGNNTPTNNIYQYIKNKYVIEQDGKLVYTESTTEGAKTINDYVTDKNWVLA